MTAKTIRITAQFAAGKLNVYGEIEEGSKKTGTLLAYDTAEDDDQSALLQTAVAELLPKLEELNANPPNTNPAKPAAKKPEPKKPAEKPAPPAPAPQPKNLFNFDDEEEEEQEESED